ncbi:MAG: helix-turn-helix transcriptional regulator [Oscillospiraceae bacterium]|nr:helix-turn-helix transcriptional regulator [Oscillospiraceae bacterium]
MKEKGATTYTLIYKGKDYNVSSSTVRRLKAGQSISTNTLDTICKILDCGLEDIVEYIPDE